MNYPKMLYKGEAKYTDNEQLRNDLFSKELKTITVADIEQEDMRREQGFVDLIDLMYKPKSKQVVVEVPNVYQLQPAMAINTVHPPSIEINTVKLTDEPIQEARVKRKYTRKVQNVGTDSA